MIKIISRILLVLLLVLSLNNITTRSVLAVVLGDANGDTCVDGIDYNVWWTFYGRTTENGASEGNFSIDDPTVPADNIVDGIDYNIWFTHYNFGSCTRQATPTPGSGIAPTPTKKPQPTAFVTVNPTLTATTPIPTPTERVVVTIVIDNTPTPTKKPQPTAFVTVNPTLTATTPTPACGENLNDQCCQPYPASFVCNTDRGLYCLLTGATRSCRSIPAVDTSINIWNSALGTNNNLYDFDNNGTVNGRDYSLWLKAGGHL